MWTWFPYRLWDKIIITCWPNTLLTLSIPCLGSRRWNWTLLNSILELNQPAVMFIFLKFHSGIEPLFFLTKHHFLTKMGHFWHTVTYIRPPAGLPVLFSLFYVVFYRTMLFALRDSSLKRGVTSRLLTTSQLFQTPILITKLSLRPSSFQTQKCLFLWAKSTILQKVTNRPTTPFGEVEEVEKWLFCEEIALIKWLFCEGKTYLSKRETRRHFFEVFILSLFSEVFGDCVRRLLYVVLSVWVWVVPPLVVPPRPPMGCGPHTTTPNSGGPQEEASSAFFRLKRPPAPPLDSPYRELLSRNDPINRGGSLSFHLLTFFLDTKKTIPFRFGNSSAVGLNKSITN